MILNHRRLCPLDRLASDISDVYTEFSDLYPSLTSEMVKEIQKSIQNGSYSFSPILVNFFFDKGECPQYSPLILHIHDPNINFSLSSREEDRLVFFTLGVMIIHYFLYEDIILMRNSFGMKMLLSDYYDMVSSSGTLNKLVVIDLTNTLSVLNKYCLLSRLSQKVKDDSIMELIEKFLHIPLKDEYGVDLTADLGCNIPPAGFLTDVILNIALSDFDMEFQSLFPELKFTRYVNEVLVYFPTSECMHVKHYLLFEELVLSIFEKLNLSGKFRCLNPGDGPVPCLGGVVCVSPDGKIQVFTMNDDGSYGSARMPSTGKLARAFD